MYAKARQPVTRMGKSTKGARTRKRGSTNSVEH